VGLTTALIEGTATKVKARRAARRRDGVFIGWLVVVIQVETFSK
jgi:hypothetical protein